MHLTDQGQGQAILIHSPASIDACGLPGLGSAVTTWGGAWHTAGKERWRGSLAELGMEFKAWHMQATLTLSNATTFSNSTAHPLCLLYSVCRGS